MFFEPVFLTHYHTMWHFDAPKEYSCRKYCEKRRKCWLPTSLKQAISPFLTMFFTLIFRFKCTLKGRPQFVLILSFSHIVFYPFRGLSFIFVKFEIVVCKLFQFRRV